MAGKGGDRATMARIGAKTRFKKGEASTKKASAKGVAVRAAQAALTSSEKLLQMNKDGTLARVLDDMLKALEGLKSQKKFDSFLKNAAWLIEMVNGRQVNIKADSNVKRNVVINFRRASPEDAK